MASPPPPPPPYPPGTSEYNAWAAQNRGPEVLILCWLFVALATVFMAGRLYARMHLFGKLKSDDYWCLASIVSFDKSTLRALNPCLAIGIS